MENLNLHKQRLYALIAAGVALIALFLPWMAAKGGFGGSANGLRSWGLISLIGVGVVAAATFMGNKTSAYEGQNRQIALGGFAAIGLGALMFLVRILTGSSGAGGFRVKWSSVFSPGIGLFLTLVIGVAGLLYLLGYIKVPQNKPPAPPATP
ncbi:MAG TPA: hypothetical protein VEB63_11295 [Chitinophagaceae bacterium]|nr:hypothetical protein [Chitinophagaceae bacterium]